ncbi:MAG: hypothetical protein ACJAT2_002791 [Bacteriovoracaceae bacterium]|jgi:hypothetical protein
MKFYTLFFFSFLFLLVSCGNPEELGAGPEKDSLFDPVEGIELVKLDDLEFFTSLGAPRSGLKKALLYLQENNNEIDNQDYLTLVDFSKHSGEKRMFILDLVNREMEVLHVAHGKNTDPSHTGMAKYFSNVNNSLKSSLGVYLTAERYYGKNGLSMRLDGKEPSNSNARRRAIVVHGAKYVSPSNSKQGRSYGCPAVQRNKISSLIERTENGSILYAFK